MRLGLFGGSFNPVHTGHLLLAECCREQCQLDRVWFVPAAVPPHKQGRELAPSETRIEMIELAIGGHPSFAVSRFEADRGGVNYTVDTLAHFREQDPDGELFFLMGADMLDDLPNWRAADRVCELAVPVAVHRQGSRALDFQRLAGIATSERIELIRGFQVQMPRIEISSTDIRRRLTARQSIRYRTPRAVEKYIETHGLYR